ncbi:ArsR family transcriptional regulator [Acinetobacter qingfengensis]|uniref:ArsR family transcriptional regulator n=1 Tax=Acinetobacter qingfengensis TaxID=1262585 RepID=A0A1E7R0C0_9GAMM|nr:ArsR family transcriptional regulator [Acinetobacter qingfengensis]
MQSVSAAPSVYPTGVTIYDPQQAWNQYNVFSGADNQSYLIDMNGNVIQKWPYRGFPTEVIDPVINQGKKGHVFVQFEEIKNKDKTSFGNGVNNHAVAELDWSGQVVWKWAGDKATGNAHQHHEISKLPNGNVLILANKLHAVVGFKLPKLIDDVLYEVDPKGKIVWQWTASEHLNEFGFTAEQLQLVYDTKLADYLHFNNARRLGNNKWYESGDQRFHPDNIIVDSRQANFIIIIDKKTGKVVWNLGPNYTSSELTNPFNSKQELPKPVDQLSGLHDAKMIAKGLPGEGNILLFDNQGGSGYPAVSYQISTGTSRVVEIDPVRQEIVWEYRPGSSFFSAFTSSARRLPNGNTQITEGQTGRIFQITKEGKIVWEYISPYLSKAEANRAASNMLYRSTPVPYQWVPVGTSRQEVAVKPPVLQDFKIAKVGKN